MRGLDAATVVEALEARLCGGPDDVLGYIVERDGRSVPQTVEALSSRVYGYAAMMPRALGNEIAAVCLYHGTDLHAAFWGAMWAGQVPTMIAPPSPRMDRGKYARSFAAMLKHVRPRWLVLDAEVRARLGDSLVLDEVTTVLDASRVASATAVKPVLANPSDIALLQHSSGTTGLQKGVALTHAALMSHARAYARRLSVNERDVIASWLPLYHDMGLIASFILPMIAGVQLIEISPFDWVASPGLLLRKISEHRATLCWQPNFAYGFLASENDREKATHRHDLSSVRAWVNCSEPTSPTAHRKFLERFAADGVREESLTTSYAMAENVFAVTQSFPGRCSILRANREIFAKLHRFEWAIGDNEALEFLSSGPCIDSTALRIRLADGTLASPGEVGEIEIRGEHLFRGYFGRPDLTAKCMTADGFYRTGDLGFVFEGEVYVTGRTKDLIIIQGRNFYPTDIEDAVAEISGVVSGRVVAFGISDPRFETEALVILAESSIEHAQARAQLALTIRKQVAQQFDCTPIDVKVFGERWLVKSTSGKLARLDNRNKYLSEFRKEA